MLNTCNLFFILFSIIFLYFIYKIFITHTIEKTSKRENCEIKIDSCQNNCGEGLYCNKKEQKCHPTLENICPYGYYLNIIGKKDCPIQFPACGSLPPKITKNADDCFSKCKESKFCGISYWDPKNKLCNQIANNYSDDNCKNCGWNNFNIYGICNKSEKDIFSLDYIKPEIINSVNDFGICDKIDCHHGACNGNNTCKCNKGFKGQDCSIEIK